MSSTETREMRPIDVRAMRSTNLSIALAAILRQAPVSRSELFELTGLKKAAVSSLVEELIRLGWIRVEGEERAAVGRPRRMLAPDPARGLLVGTRIGVDHLAVLVADFAGTELGCRWVESDVASLSPAEAAGRLAATMRSCLDDLGAPPHAVLGTALALPGIVGAMGELSYAPGLGWGPEDVGGLLAASVDGVAPSGTLLMVENEANLATLAEQRYGRMQDVPNFVYLLGQAGIGAGVVIDGELFRGTRGAGGEVGHLTLDVNGPRCPCGKRGCWAVFIGEPELARLASGGRVRRLSRYVAAGIGNLVATYDPGVVVLGGSLGTAFADRLPQLRTEVDAWLMGEDLYPDLRIEVSAFGPDASLWGGIAAVLDQLVADPRRAAAVRT